jgi:hypothetical protein
VYKKQGRIRSDMLKRTYKAFLIHAALAGSNPDHASRSSFAMPFSTA